MSCEAERFDKRWFARFPNRTFRVRRLYPNEKLQLIDAKTFQFETIERCVAVCFRDVFDDVFSLALVLKGDLSRDPDFLETIDEKTLKAAYWTMKGVKL